MRAAASTSSMGVWKPVWALRYAFGAGFSALFLICAGCAAELDECPICRAAIVTKHAMNLS